MDVNMETEKVVRLLRQAGAVVGIDPAAPEDVKKAFLRMILNCPDCQDVMRRKDAIQREHTMDLTGQDEEAFNS